MDLGCHRASIFRGGLRLWVFWYASGATVQILYFATLAIESKRKTPNARTLLEVIRARYGVNAHLVYTLFGLILDALVRQRKYAKSEREADELLKLTAILRTRGSIVLSALTGMPMQQLFFPIPTGVVLYTTAG